MAHRGTLRFHGFLWGGSAGLRLHGSHHSHAGDTYVTNSCPELATRHRGILRCLGMPATKLINVQSDIVRGSGICDASAPQFSSRQVLDTSGSPPEHPEVPVRGSAGRRGLHRMRHSHAGDTCVTEQLPQACSRAQRHPKVAGGILGWLPTASQSPGGRVLGQDKMMRYTRILHQTSCLALQARHRSTLRCLRCSGRCFRGNPWSHLRQKARGGMVLTCHSLPL